MSGFGNDAVDSACIANTRILFRRNPRLTFEEAGRFA